MMCRAFRQLAALLLLAALPALVWAGVHRHPPAAVETIADGEITVSAALALGENVLWVDARTRGQFERGHIPGALLLNEDDWDELSGPFLDAWETGQVVIVYCDGGGCDASHAVAKRLKEDFQIDNDIKVLKGGWDAWHRKN